MYTRNVSMKLKVNSAKEFTQTLENEVIPVLRKQRDLRMRSLSSPRNVTMQ